MTSRVGGPDPFVKRAHAEPAGGGFPPPPAVPAMRRELKVDFGKIDDTEAEGRVSVLDVNRTPSLPGDPAADARVVAALVEGADDFLAPATNA
jgi:hypothetical protein